MTKKKKLKPGQEEEQSVLGHSVAKVMHVLLPANPHTMTEIKDRISDLDWIVYSNFIRNLGREQGKNSEGIEDILQQTENSIKEVGGFTNKER